MLGDHDHRRAVDALAATLPAPLRSLAGVAYDYRWSWTPGGEAVFAAIDPDRWARVHRNPVALLVEAGRERLDAAAGSREVVAAAEDLAAALAADRDRPPATGTDPRRPVAFFCAEFGIHGSLPIYSGGLGVLAGDIVKEAADRAVPMVGVGLLYRRGYFHQRVDRDGWQHEHWRSTDVERLPAVAVRDPDGRPLEVEVPVGDRTVRVRTWRVDVGRVPLFLLDTDVGDNSPIDRWITARLYDGNRSIRLAQYTVLGVGGARVLAAGGIDPSVVHLNEGHAGLAALELAARRGGDPRAALAAERERVVFTTHTPVAAGNETYGPDEVLAVLDGLPARIGLDREAFLDLGRTAPGDPGAPVGLTPLTLRGARIANGVSARHGDVARAMWRDLDGAARIVHVTNGVHVPTWTSPPLRALLDRHLGRGWTERAADPRTWEPVAGIPPAELWAARCEARAALVAAARERSVRDRLTRGEELEYVEAARDGLDPEALTIGFARRLAAYKRLHLLTREPDRALRLLFDGPPVQILFGGKAHPEDQAGKDLLHGLFAMKDERVGRRVAFLEDYDLGLAPVLVAGCDLWVNVPRPPSEASGTSGMKAALNGALNLSVLDGWWCEAYDGTNGWAIDGHESDDPGAQDGAHAAALFDLLEREVVPAFTERDDQGVPQRWVAMVKASLRTCGPRFSAARMLDDYRHHVYPPGAPAPEVSYRLEV